MQRRLPTTHPTIIQIILKLSSSLGWVVDGVDVVIVLEMVLLLLAEVVLLLLVVVAAAGGDDAVVGDGADIDVVGNIVSVSMSGEFI